jgi:hypothetical protein
VILGVEAGGEHTGGGGKNEIYETEQQSSPRAAMGATRAARRNVVRFMVGSFGV